MENAYIRIANVCVYNNAKLKKEMRIPVNQFIKVFYKKVTANIRIQFRKKFGGSKCSWLDQLEKKNYANLSKIG